MPSTVKVLKWKCFLKNTALVTINLDNVEETHNGLESCTNVENIGSTANLKIIGKYAFYQCSKLTSMDLSSATQILTGGLRSCTGLTMLNIPSTVTKIDIEAFRGCTGLTEFTLNWADPATVIYGTKIFRGLTIGSITLNVPTGTKGLYDGTADGSGTTWAGFKEYLEFEPSLSSEDILSEDLDIQISSNTLTVNSSFVVTGGNLTIYDITGKVLVNDVLNGTSVAKDIANLASGIYIVKVTIGNAELVKRFAK